MIWVLIKRQWGVSSAAAVAAPPAAAVPLPPITAAPYIPMREHFSLYTVLQHFYATWQEKCGQQFAINHAKRFDGLY